jgi:hypothetical protein
LYPSENVLSSDFVVRCAIFIAEVGCGVKMLIVVRKKVTTERDMALSDGLTGGDNPRLL